MTILGMSRTFIAERVHGKRAVLYGGKQHLQVNSLVNFAQSNNSLWVSLGASKKRERLFFDEQSCWFQALRSDLEKTCKEKRTIQEILSTVNQKIDSLSTIPNRSLRTLEIELANFLASQERNAEGFIDLTMDQLVDKKILACRHEALMGASLLGTLVKKGILPPGTVRQYRTNLMIAGKSVGHAWVVYHDFDSNDFWICDPRWLNVKKVSPDCGECQKRYGQETIERMIQVLSGYDTPLRDTYLKTKSNTQKQISHQKERDNTLLYVPLFREQNLDIRPALRMKRSKSLNELTSSKPPLKIRRKI